MIETRFLGLSYIISSYIGTSIIGLTQNLVEDTSSS